MKNTSLSVFQNLIRDDKVYRFIPEWQWLIFDIHRYGLDAFTLQDFFIPVTKINAGTSNLLMVFFNDHQIVTASTSQVHAYINSQAFGDIVQDMSSIGLRVINGSKPTRCTRHYFSEQLRTSLCFCPTTELTRRDRGKRPGARDLLAHSIDSSVIAS
jgi:hypothetical protein